MALPATVEEFKAQFDRDFIYGQGKETVRDIDISRALTEATSVFNSEIWSQDELKPAYLYASAHFLVLNIQMAGGLSPSPSGKGTGNRGGGITQSKSVAQVSVQYSIPQSILESPSLNQFMRTDYGLRYLQMVTPR